MSMSNLAPMYSSSAIADRVKDIAEQINKEYAGENIVHMVITLTGAFMFAADLIRHVKVPLSIHFAGGQSFFGASDDTRVDANAIPVSFGNAPVIIVEDIVGGGVSIAALRQIIADRFASNIKVATLLKRQGASTKVDYYGFTIPKNLFIVGYGMDMDGRYREMADIKAISNVTAGGMC